MTALRRSFPAIPIAAALMASVAQAETRATADVAIDGGYASNLYLRAQENTGSASASFRLDPNVTITGPTSTIQVGGTLNHHVYAKRYDSATNWALRSSAQFRLSPLSSLGLNASYSDEITSALNTDAIEPLPTDPGTAPLPDPTAPNLTGQRRKAFAGGASFQTSLSPRTSMSLSATASSLDYNQGETPAGYFTVGSSAGVSHSFDEGLSGGATISYSRTDFDAAAYGTATYISPQANATLALAPRTSLSVSAGVTFSDSSGIVGGGKRTNFSGSVSLCQTGDRGSGCLSAVRSTGAASQAGGSTSTAFGADYSYRLTPRSDISAGVQYSTSRSVALGGFLETRYGTARANYAHKLTERLSFSLRANYTKSFESVLAPAENFFGGVRLSYRFG